MFTTVSENGLGIFADYGRLLLLLTILADYDNEKTIDTINIYNKPDKGEVRDLVQGILQIIFPGYFRDRSYKIYNPRNSLSY